MLKKHAEEWNGRIREWHNNPQKYFENDLFYQSYSGKNRTKIEVLGLPEPYLGDIFGRCSAVILSLNPGQLLKGDEQLHPNGKFILDGAVDNYREWAKKWYYINESKNKFWENKVEWINRRIEETTLLPFGIELIPYHSTGWGRINKNQSVIELVEKKILLLAEEKAKESLFKSIIAIGKDYYEIFKALDYKLICEISQSNLMDEIIELWPRKKDGSLINRTYSVWESDRGATYLQIYAPGSNKAPSKDFLGIEEYIKGNYLMG